MTFLRHPAWLWLEKHAPEKLPTHDADTLAIFATGHAFEAHAEQLWPDALKLGFHTSDGEFDYELYRSLLERTADAKDGEHSVLLQGRVEVDGLTCIFDVLERTTMGLFNLYEIKSSTGASREHELDLAFQVHVLEQAGYTIDKISVVHVNSEYVRRGDIVAHEIVAVTEVTNAVRELQSETEGNITEALKVMRSEKMPDPSPRFARLGSYKQWLNVYEGLIGGFSPYSVYRLAGAGARRIGELEDIGVTEITHIPEEFHLTSRQQSQVKVTKESERHIDRAHIKDFMQMLQFPLYFLDYETFMSLVPAFDGLRPYQQVPFQYSLHILEYPGTELQHREYLHTENTLSVEPLLAQLVRDVGPEGSVLVWHESFEKGRNVEMASLAPEYNNFLYQLNDRVIDLKIPFSKEWFVDKDFYGSASIKDVLPVLVPELSYKELDINSGNTAQRIWMEVVQQGRHQEQRDQILTDLRKYCHLDTLAMVRIWEELYAVAQGESGESSRTPVE